MTYSVAAAPSAAMVWAGPRAAATSASAVTHCSFVPEIAAARVAVRRLPASAAPAAQDHKEPTPTGVGSCIYQLRGSRAEALAKAHDGELHLIFQEASSRHLRGGGNAHELQECGRDVGDDADRVDLVLKNRDLFWRAVFLLRLVDEHEGNGTG